MKNRVIAGVVALAVVVALAGLAVVAGRDSGPRAPATLPVLGSASGGGAAQTSSAMADSKMRVAPVTYVAGKLPGLADEADAWKLTAGEADEARIAELAKTLGVDGSVSKTETGWSVGTEVRRLDVQAVAGLPWSLYESVPADTSVSSGTATTGSIECVKAPCEGAGSPGSPGSPGSRASSGSLGVADCAADACDQPMEAQRPADLPSKAEAEKIGRRLLSDLGVDLDHAEVRIDDSITLWNVVADPVVGGLPTVGLSSSIGVGPKGVAQFANGWLGTPTKGDRYPLIGTAAALERLNKEQSQIMIAPVDPQVRCLECTDTTPAEPRVVRVTGVRLGLQVFSTFEQGADGYLVPTYLFATEDGGELPVVAVADQYLGQTPKPAEPEPGTPAEPSGTGACSLSQSAGTGPNGPSVVGPEVQVCVSDPALAGRPVTFTVTGKGNLRDDCGSPVPEWGDGSEVAVCDIGCASLPPEPRQISKTFEHTYAKAGTYTAVFHFTGCGSDSGTDRDQAKATLEVRVGT